MRQEKHIWPMLEEVNWLASLQKCASYQQISRSLDHESYVTCVLIKYLSYKGGGIHRENKQSPWNFKSCLITLAWDSAIYNLINGCLFAEQIIKEIYHSEQIVECHPHILSKYVLATIIYSSNGWLSGSSESWVRKRCKELCWYFTLF